MGDWYIRPDAGWAIAVSDMSDWRYEFLVAIHELTEMALCIDREVSQTIVDEFDKEYEVGRPDDDVSEPGDDPRAPYAAEHCAATGVERLLASMLGVSWSEYADAIEKL